jgi:hypothetical protein
VGAGRAQGDQTVRALRSTVDDIPVKKHVRISPDLNPAATAEIPDNKNILARCGTYISVTKDRSAYDRLESMITNWSIDESS